MKKLSTLLLGLMIAASLSSCGNEKPENPDPDFEKVYQGDSDAKPNTKTTMNEEKTNDSDLPVTPTEPVKVDQMTTPSAGDVVATMKTSMGDIKIKMFPEATPLTYKNFRGLAEKGFYDGLIFHRVINNFMIQGGDPLGTGMGGESIYGKEFADEPSPYLKNVRGALSMANRGPNTNTSQFFIVQAQATPYLDGYQGGKKTCGQFGKSCHTVFGQVYEGLDVIDSIAQVEKNKNDKPLTDVTIDSIKFELLK